ncbi:MAG: hypothetical protein GEU96_20245, partial [Propionibacteriales bacterium]|nr:hypothetical protein [Propionibacteriales bacterium]
ERLRSLLEMEVPEELARAISVLPPAYSALSIVETSKRDSVDPHEVAKAHFAIGDKLGIGPLTQRIVALPRTDRWQTMARAALRDDLGSVHAQITAQVLRGTDSGLELDERIKHWAEADGLVLSRAASTLEEIWSDDVPDLARLSVGLRVVRTLLQSPG